MRWCLLLAESAMVVGKENLMSQNQVERLTIGIDLGDRVSHYCVINDQGVVLEEGRMRTLQESVRRWAQAFSGARMVIEAGTHSAWMSRLLQELGHEVIVGNAGEIAALRRTNKNDRRDAERLARYGRIENTLSQNGKPPPGSITSSILLLLWA